MNSEKLLEMEGISKRFSGIQALSNAKFELLKGEIHALMGANGAGKSTLIKILCGVHQSDSGSFKISGQQVLIRNPFEAQKHGIAYVPQEIAVQPYMTVAENIFLGRHPIKNHLIDFKTMENMCKNDYISIVSSHPEWNFQERGDKWPIYIREGCNLINTTSTKKSKSKKL